MLKDVLSVELSKPIDTHRIQFYGNQPGVGCPSAGCSGSCG